MKIFAINGAKKFCAGNLKRALDEYFQRHYCSIK